MADITMVGREIKDWITPPQRPYRDVETIIEYPDLNSRFIIIKVSSIELIGIKILESVVGSAILSIFLIATEFVYLTHFELQT